MYWQFTELRLHPLNGQSANADRELSKRNYSVHHRGELPGVLFSLPVICFARFDPHSLTIHGNIRISVRALKHNTRPCAIFRIRGVCIFELLIPDATLFDRAVHSRRVRFHGWILVISDATDQKIALSVLRSLKTNNGRLIVA